MSALRPWRLVAQIYALALLTLLLVALSLVALVRVLRDPPGLPRMASYLAHEIASREDPAARQAAADRFAERLDSEVALFSLAGERLVASRGAEIAALAPADAAAVARGEPRTAGERGLAVPVTGADGRPGYGVVRLQLPPPPVHHAVAALAVVFGVLAITSLLLARRLLGPLRRLAAATRAFGAGDVRARVGLPPRGALGALGAVFDEMAGRVAGLLQAQRELLANVSHELRTPLARLRVALEIAGESEPAAARDELRAAEEDLAQLERMVADVLRAASLDLAALQPAGSQSALRRERVDVGALAQRTARRFAAAWSERPVEVDAPDGPLWADVDPELLRRALDNLLDNARKYSEAGATIRVRARDDGDAVALVVEDAGIGIDPADQPHVFTPFFRADRSRTRGTGGVGLGLTLVRRIVEAHGGTVALDSAPGRGTRAVLRVPRAAGELPPRA